MRGKTRGPREKSTFKALGRTLENRTKKLHEMDKKQAPDGRVRVWEKMPVRTRATAFCAARAGKQFRSTRVKFKVVPILSEYGLGTLQRTFATFDEIIVWGFLARFSSVMYEALDTDFSLDPRVFPRILQEMRGRRQCQI